ncbi:ABC transporter permease subunit [Rhodobacteraceae bacterium KMM 6894]|nr:ABC transporter permease subunit [Rhodobacteraceae bacterium KMM 6894]
MADPANSSKAAQTSAVRFGWPAVILVSLVCVLLMGQVGWIAKYPDVLELPIGKIFNAFMRWMVANTEPFFKAINLMLSYPMTWMRDLLAWLPWSAFTAVMVMVAYRARGATLAAFTGISLLYILGVDLWDESMNSFALVFISVPLAVMVGFVLGVWGAYSPRAERAIMPLLDIAQTIPAFAYLLPILLLFGFGPVVGLVASILFSFPPMVRNTMLGLRGVAAEVVESGLMSGATGAQLFWRVRFPSALKQILIGVNQTTMASLSMVIIASIIGGTADIGWEVLSTMRKAQFGESLIAGIVIALMAMILDRITFGLAERQGSTLVRKTFAARYGFGLSLLGVAVVLVILAAVLPFLAQWPEAWHFDMAGPLNRGIEWFVVVSKPTVETIKTAMLFFVMLPLKMGLDKVVSPFTWGFTLTPWHVAGYTALIVLAAGVAWRKGRNGLATSILLGGLVFYIGLSDMPWIAVLAILTWFAYRLGGRKLAIGTALGLAFLLLSGSWDKAMLSLYLCAIAVSLSFVIGTSLGILAAQYDGFSHFMRPINDTMQTLPPFVLLIPVVMIFKIGEFAALLAIIGYAYVPAFRYTEHGLRHVSETVVEAASSLGTSRAQMLFWVKIPLALPNIMLGLNQSIMYGIAMLVIAALVGTTGLGQEVYVGLSAGNFGQGFVAGIGMAIIAITADRFCQAWQRNQQKHLSEDPS